MSIQAGMLSEKRALAAVHFVDGEILRLLRAIEALGTKNSQQQPEVLFGTLVKQTEGVFESVIAMLTVAKRRQFVAYDAAALVPGVHDGVVITALQLDVPPSDPSQYSFAEIQQLSVRKKRGSIRAQRAQRSCVSCNKAIAAFELVSVGRFDHYHKHCFRCTTCNQTLEPTNFEPVDGKLYCRAHADDAEGIAAPTEVISSGGIKKERGSESFSAFSSLACHVTVSCLSGLLYRSNHLLFYLFISGGS